HHMPASRRMKHQVVPGETRAGGEHELVHHRSTMRGCEYNARMQRREFLTTLAAAAYLAQSQPAIEKVARKGRIKEAAMRTNFDPMMPFEDLCREIARLGAYGVDLAGPNDWPTLKKYGLVPTMGGAGPIGFEDGVIRKELHGNLEKPFHDWIDQCAA